MISTLLSWLNKDDLSIGCTFCHFIATDNITVLAPTSIARSANTTRKEHFQSFVQGISYFLLIQVQTAREQLEAAAATWDHILHELEVSTTAINHNPCYKPACPSAFHLSVKSSA
jgi:hypothetical protein